MAREALLGIAVGKKGVGKTYCTLEMTNDYLVRNKRKVLILDVNNEFGNVQQDQNKNFQHIKSLSIRDVKRFTEHPTIEARRISVFKEDGTKMSLNELAQALHEILDNYQNGLLLIEDINKFVSDNLPNDLMGSIVTQRHMSVDIITHFQSVGKMAQPKLWANANWIRFHKCDDTVERHKNKFGGTVSHLKIMEAMVNNEYDKGNKHFYVYLDKDAGKIKGKFNKQMFIDGIDRYFSENLKIVKDEARRENPKTGVKIHKDQPSAYEYLIQHYIKEYYGNPY